MKLSTRSESVKTSPTLALASKAIELKSKGVEIKVDLRDEPWGDRHFAIADPNGIGIDFVKYSKPEEE